MGEVGPRTSSPADETGIDGHHQPSDILTSCGIPNIYFLVAKTRKIAILLSALGLEKIGMNDPVGSAKKRKFLQRMHVEFHPWNHINSNIALLH